MSTGGGYVVSQIEEFTFYAVGWQRGGIRSQ